MLNYLFKKKSFHPIFKVYINLTVFYEIKYKNPKDHLKISLNKFQKTDFFINKIPKLISITLHGNFFRKKQN